MWCVCMRACVCARVHTVHAYSVLSITDLRISGTCDCTQSMHAEMLVCCTLYMYILVV